MQAVDTQTNTKRFLSLKKEKEKLKKEKKGIYKDKKLTSTVSLNRYPLFRVQTDSIDKKLKLKDKIPEEKLYLIHSSEQGKCYSNLDQTHKDILEAIFVSHTEVINDKMILDKYGANVYVKLGFKFKVQDILNMLSEKKYNYNYSWFYQKLNEIKSGFIYIETKNTKIHANIVDSLIEITENNNIKTKYFILSLTNAFSHMLLGDYKIYTNKQLVKNIIKIRHGIVKAIVRYLLTQKDIKIYLSTLLQHLNYYNQIADRRMRHKIINIVKSYKEHLKNFGINMELTQHDILLTYKQQPNKIVIDYTNLNAIMHIPTN